MNIVMTGATGFLGSHLAEDLRARGNRVRCLVRGYPASFPADMERDGLEVVQVDFAKSDELACSLKDAEYVYHVAGTTRARITEDYYRGNRDLTRAVAEACVRSGAALKRFVHVSSLSAIGPTVPDEKPDETTTCRPVSHYGQSKLQAEEEVRRLDSKLPFVIVRPGAIYGPRDHDLYLYFKMIQKRFYPRVGRLRRLLNIAHVDDIVRGIVLAGEARDAVGQTYMIGAEQSSDTDEIARAIAVAMGIRPFPITVPVAGVKLLGALSELQGRILHSAVFFNLQKAREACALAWNCSIAKARAQLGYHPMVALDEGIERTYRWYCRAGLLHA